MRPQKLAPLALLLGALAVASPALADDKADRAHAKEAYDRGLDAHKHGEMARAAKEFATADSYLPSPAALQAALDAAIEADDVALGAELLERAKRAPAPPSLASSITAATMKFNGRAGKLLIHCPKSAACTAKIDEAPALVDKVIWAGVGPRTVSVQVDSGQPQAKAVEVAADDTVEVTAARGMPLGVKSANGAASPDTTESSNSTPSRRESEGISPAWFYVGAGVTVAAAGVTTYLMLRTSSKHSDFENAGCANAANAGCSDLASSGKSAQSTANVGLIVTAGAALVTTVIAIAFVNWQRDSPHGTRKLRPGTNGFAVDF